MASWIGYTPDMWATGNEPMTDPQSRYLWVMSNRTHTRIPFISRNNNGQNVTKAEASILLTKFENEEPVDAAFIDGLGREELGTEPGHPLTWFCCHDPPTPVQTQWIQKLTLGLWIATDVTQKKTVGITRGQASWLIKLLRAEWRQRTAEWLEDAVTASIEEVPLPDEGEGVDGDYHPDEDEDSMFTDEEDEMEVDVTDDEVDLQEVQELLAEAKL